MSQLNFDHLDGTEFENFCFDLLQVLDFKNLDWRKGTGHKASPSDRGRDIVGQLLVKDVDGSEGFETWFIECKHHKAGVPSTKIEGALSWSSAEQPDKLLIIASGFLSNHAKDFLERYKENNKPKFKIKIWEQPDLESLCVGKNSLLIKYGIDPNLSIASILHPAHLSFLKTFQANSLEYFFQVLDSADPIKRDQALELNYFLTFPRNIELKPSEYGSKKIPRVTDEFTYQNFKDYCWRLQNYIDPSFIISGLIHRALQGLLKFGDITSVQDEILQSKRRKEKLERLEELPEDEQEFYKHLFDRLVEEYLGLFKDRDDAIKKHIQMTNIRIDTIEANTQNNYSLYTWFCEQVVEKLLQEKILYSEE